MRTLKLALAALALLATSLVASPAHADVTGRQSTLIHASDDGYDEPIIYTCTSGPAPALANAPRLAEGKESDCVTAVYIRAGEELWCYRLLGGWYKALDATGWHSSGSATSGAAPWDPYPNYGCVLHVD